MAIIELQIRTPRFLDFLRNRINRARLPFATWPSTGVLSLMEGLQELKGGLLQQIECTRAALVPGSESVPINIELMFRYNSLYATIKNAGSLNAPVMEAVGQNFELALSLRLEVLANGRARGVLTCSSLVSGIFPAVELPIQLPDIFNVRVAGLVANENIVALRFGTNGTDDAGAPDIVDRLANDDWALFVHGQCLGDFCSDQLAGGIPEDFDVTNGPNGAWFPAAFGQGPYAAASATITVANACVVDVPVDLDLTAWIVPAGSSITITARLHWDPDTTFCDLFWFNPLAGIIVSYFINKSVASQAAVPSGGTIEFHEVDRTDDSISLQGTLSLAGLPQQFQIAHSEINNEGLLWRGSVLLQSSVRNLQGSVSVPSSSLHRDCPSRSVSVRFEPARVVLFDLGLEEGAPRLFNSIVQAEIEPPPPRKPWDVRIEPSSFWRELTVSFIDPPGGRLDAGTKTNVFLHTDCGIRWIDLGVIPEDHPLPTSGDIAGMLSTCMALSDPWGRGVLNLDWLVDPPDLRVGIDPLRLWAFTARDLPVSAQLQFIAVGSDGRNRVLGQITGQRRLAIQFATRPDETVKVISEGAVSAPTPTVLQRWLVPFARIPIESEPVSVRARGGKLAILDSKGEGYLLEHGADGNMRTQQIDRQASANPAFNRLRSALVERPVPHADHWGIPLLIDSRTAAVTHDRELFVGFITPARRM